MEIGTPTYFEIVPKEELTLYGFSSEIPKNDVQIMIEFHIFFHIHLQSTKFAKGTHCANLKIPFQIIGILDFRRISLP